jgi:hypothetical protein
LRISLFAAALSALAALSCGRACGGEAGEGGPPASEPASVAGGAEALRLELDGEAVAEFGRGAGLLLRKGEIVLAAGRLLVAGKKGFVGQEAMSVERVPGDVSPPTWLISGDDKPGRLQGRVRVWSLGRAVAVDCKVSLRDRGSAMGWGYLVELPAAAHAGSQVRIGGRTVELPKAAAAADKAELYRGRVRAARVVRDGKVVLRVLRDVPAEVSLCDLRPAGAAGFGLLFGGEPPEGGGEAEGRFCIAMAAGGGKIRPLVYHAELWPPARPGSPVRAEIGVLADYRSAFDPAQVKVDLTVTPPVGAAFRQPAYYAREFFSRVEIRKAEPAEKGAEKPEPVGGRGKAEEPEEVEVEVLDPLGAAGWRALIGAEAAGVYTAGVEVVTPAGKARAETGPLRLVRAGGARMGPLRVAKRDRRFLVDPQGKPVFLLGHNLAWLVDVRGPLSLARWVEALERMKKAGLNYARVWNCTWSLWLETGKPYSYDLSSAWKLDRVLEEAAARGIHVQLCMDNFHDFRLKRELSPYFAGKKPVCASTRDFFIGEEARRMYAAKLRYMAARYGHHPNLMAWELWNELDYSIDKNIDPEELAAGREEYLVSWARWAAREISAVDRRRRMVTCSLADGTIWPELSGAPEIGLVEAHVYLYMPDEEGKRPAKSARSALEEASREFARFRKPGFVSEFGFGASGGPTSPINKVDRLGVHLHNGLWISAMSGHAGATALWWWDSYLAPAGAAGKGTGTEITGEDRYWHYRALARYLRGVDWLAGWKKLTISPPSPEGAQPVVVGMRTDRDVMAWVADPANSWYSRAVKGYKPPEFRDVSIGIDGLKPGTYRVTWWDTYAGKVRTSSAQETDAGGSLRVKVPPFSRDVAARIQLIEARGAGNGGDAR